MKLDISLLDIISANVKGLSNERYPMKNNFPLVSIIIPNYNHARYLDQRICTVLNQTYKNFEVIILDDCSTDNSLMVIDKYRNNPHISHIVVNEHNSGSPFKQWDKGISLAKGELIWIAESDDYCKLNFLMVMVGAIVKYDGVVLARSQYVFTNDDNMISYKERITRRFDGKRFVLRRLSRFNEVRNASGVIFRRDTYSRISREYLEYRSAGDYLFWAEYLQFGDIILVGKNLSYFRQSCRSVTGTSGTKGITSTEDKKVNDFIMKAFQPNRFEHRMIIAAKARQYRRQTYDNELVRRNILSMWGINLGFGESLLFDFFFWLSGSLERHVGLLI